MNASSVEDVSDRLAAMLVEQLAVRVPAAQIHGDSSLKEDLGLDSVAMVELVGAIEAEFGVEFRESDLRGSVFATIGTLAAVVVSRLTE
jgi:acyl carrier protein